MRLIGLLLRLFFGAGMIWVLYLLRANHWFRLYPLVISSAVWFLFLRSLFGVPLVERFARRMGEELDAAGVQYCRRVTRAWVVFLTLHLAVTAATLFLSYRIWAFYNGLLAYVLMGCMFAGEFVIRKWVKRERNR